MVTDKDRENLSIDDRKWLHNIWDSKKLESEYGDCPTCGDKNAEFKRWQLADSTIKKLCYCPTCRAKYEEAEKQRVLNNKQAQLEDTRHKWRSTCGIPLRFASSRFEGFDLNVDRTIKQVYNECMKFTNEFSCVAPQKSKSVLMYSKNVWGVGKTYLVCAVANAVLDKWNDEITRCPIRFASEPQLLLRVRSTYNRQNNGEYRETEDDIYKELVTAPLLILDDVGKEEVADPRFVQRVLFSIIDGRYQNMLPIIVTTNLTPDELDAHLGGDRGNSASMDRLMEMTDNVFYELMGKSYRDISKRGK